MAQSDIHPDPKTRQGRQQRQELAPNQSTVPGGQNAENNPTAQNTDTHSFPPCTTWLSAETLDMHCTDDDHRRHCCRLLKKKSGSPIITCRARSDSCIRQRGPSTSAQLCLKHQHAGNNPSLYLQLCVKQTIQSSISATRI